MGRMDYIVSAAEAPPMSIQEIAKKAIDFEYNPLIPLRYWLRTVDTLHKEANIYEREGNEQQAYLLLLRQAELIVKYLPNHPQATSPENIRHLRNMRNRLDEPMKRLEYLKPRIQARYQAWEAAQREREARMRDYEDGRSSRESLSSSSSNYMPFSYARAQSLSQNRISTQSAVPKPLDLARSRRGSASSQSGPFSPLLERDGASTPGHEIRSTELAMEIARQEFARREREKLERRSRQISTGSSKWRDREVMKVESPTSQTVEDRYHALKQQYAPSSYYDDTTTNGLRHNDDDLDLQRTIRNLNIYDGYDTRHSTDRPSSKRDGRASRARDNPTGGTWQYEYPSVPKRTSSSSIHPPPLVPQYPQRKAVPPPVPSKEPLRRDSTQTPPSTVPLPSVYPPPPPPPVFPSSMQPPSVPKKTPMPLPSPPPSLPTLPASLTNPHQPPPPPPYPAPRLTDKPLDRQRLRTSTYEFKPIAKLESGVSLRTVFLPSTLRHKFLEIAYPNTSRNLETCGLLCGTLIQNALFISRLVIPEQEVTSDTCDMKDEEELFKYVFEEDLIVLGWIHTHPQYECFMSSVDLHNHCGYQLMLPESIAVVCAPRFQPSWGVFRLTDPPGVKTIMTCTQKGLFHPHTRAEELYTDAMRPGHVCVVDDMSFEVVDLRK